MFRATDHIRTGQIAFVSLAMLGFTTPALAQQNPSLDPVFQCHQIQGDAERLACYDAAVGSLRAESGEIVVIRRSEVEAVERDSFGLALPSLPRLSLSLFSTRDNQLEESSGTDAGSSSAQAADAAGGVSVIRREDDGQINEISLPIERVERIGFDTIHIHTTNGQVWEITDRVGNRPVRVRDDSVMVVRRATLGSYLMQIDGRDRSYRVQRLR